jgi:hypothetical protein
MRSWKHVVAALCFVSTANEVLAEPPDRGLLGDTNDDRALADVMGDRHTDPLKVPPELEAALLEMVRTEGSSDKAAGDLQALDKDLAAAAAALATDGQLKAAQGALQRGLYAEADETSLEQQLTALHARAEEARERVWKQWQSMVDVSTADAQRELAKHALREAKLLRIQTLAQETGDADALEPVRKLLAMESRRSDKRMHALIEDSAPPAPPVKEPPQ